MCGGVGDILVTIGDNLASIGDFLAIIVTGWETIQAHWGGDPEEETLNVPPTYRNFTNQIQFVTYSLPGPWDYIYLFLFLKVSQVQLFYFMV